MSKFKILFDPTNGHFLTYVGYSEKVYDKLTVKILWEDNFLFYDTMQYVYSKSGKSSKTMIFISLTTGKKYPVMFRDFDKLIRRDDLKPGPTLSGYWTFTKCGQSYGIRPATPKEIENEQNI